MTTDAFDLLVVGDLNPDLVVSAADVRPVFGQAEKLLESATLTIGSSAGIVACGAARLGLSTALVGAVGDDPFGRFMLAELQERGIDNSGCVVRENRATGVSVVLSQPDDRAILTYLGALAELRYDDIDKGLLARARHLHVSSYFLLHALRPDLPRLFAAAKGRGLTTSLDTNWDPTGEWGDGLQDALPHVDLLLPNEAEALRLSGASNLDEAIAWLGERVPLVVVKRGALGCLARHQGERLSVAALPVEPVDATGAGDSFVAGFLYGHVKGWGVPEALRLASACGSLSTLAAGGTAAQPGLAEARAAAARLAPAALEPS